MRKKSGMHVVRRHGSRFSHQFELLTAHPDGFTNNINKSGQVLTIPVYANPVFKNGCLLFECTKNFFKTILQNIAEH